MYLGTRYMVGWQTTKDKYHNVCTVYWELCLRDIPVSVQLRQVFFCFDWNGSWMDRKEKVTEILSGGSGIVGRTFM